MNVVAASLSLLTPRAAVVGLAALLPVAGVLAGRAHADSVRRALHLPAPSRKSGYGRAAALGVAVALLGLAAAQPALTSETGLRVRKDAQALFVLDTSRSMGASATPTGPTRLDRATRAATTLRNAIPQVEAGVATLTDRVLPDLLPVGDRAGFDAVVSRAVAIESPPPGAASVRATSYSALAAIPGAGYFAPRAETRVVVLLTDGESVATDTGELARAFATAPGYRLVTVRFWDAGESIYRGTERESAYRPDPTGAAALAALAESVRGHAFEESNLGDAAGALRSALGSGPTVAARGTARTRTLLAPYLAGLSLLLLAGFWTFPRLREGALGRPSAQH